MGEENTVSEDKGINTSFTASPRIRNQLSVVTAYNRLSSKSKMINKLIEVEYAFVQEALDKTRRLEEELAEVSNGEDAEG